MTDGTLTVPLTPNSGWFKYQNQQIQSLSCPNVLITSKPVVHFEIPRVPNAQKFGEYKPIPSSKGVGRNVMQLLIQILFETLDILHQVGESSQDYFQNKQ